MASRFPQGHSHSVQSAKYSALASMLDRLVDGTKSHTRKVITRFVAEKLLTPFQREAVEKNTSDETMTKMVFDCVLGAVARDDSLFDRLIPILQDLGHDNLADELLGAALPSSLSSPHNQGQGRRTSHEDLPHSRKLPKAAYQGPELDSGFASRNPTSRQDIIDNLPEEQSELHSSLNRLQLASTGISSNSRNSHEEHSNSSAALEHEMSMNQDHYSHTINDSSSQPQSHISTNNPSPLLQPQLELHNPQVELQPRLELHEPLTDIHNDEQQERPAPIQAAGSNLPSDIIVLPNGNRLMSETMPSVATIEDDLIESMTDRIHHMRQELYQREAEGRHMHAENLELQKNCTKLEEEVKLVSDKLKHQEQETERIEKEKDAEITDWKKKYKDKENEVKCLAETIAQIEKEKENMTVEHGAQINELNAKHRRAEKENNQKVAGYQTRITTLEKNLEEANQKKEKAEVELAYAREHIANLKLQKEQELSKMKDERHALELKIRDLNEKVLKKELLLQSKDKELAQEKHEQERRQSLALQEQVNELKREIDRLRSQSS